MLTAEFITLRMHHAETFRNVYMAIIVTLAIN